MQDPAADRHRRILPEFAFHTVAAAVLLMFVSIRFGQPFWSLKPLIAGMVLLAAGAYWSSAIGLIVLERRGRTVAPALAAAVCLAAAVAVLTVGAVVGSSLPRTAALWAPLVGLALLLAGRILRPWLSWKLLAAFVVLAGVGLAVTRAAPIWLKARALAREKPTTSVFQIRTSLYDLSVTSFSHYTPRTSRSSGGLTLFADRYLLVDGNGDLFLFKPSGDFSSLEFRALAYRAPSNYQEFADAAGALPRIHNFRIADVIAQEKNGTQRIFVTHHFWKAAEQCWVMRVSSLQGAPDDFLAGTPSLKWKTVFETSPCIPLALEGEPPRFGGLENGGRMAWLSDTHLLVTIGDHGLDGWTSAVRAPRDAAYSHGKIFLIDVDNGTSEIYSFGHRNAQGLTVGSSGLIWSTEHGPEGGDELNLIRKGGDYGWPMVSYGTDYGSHSWPLAAKSGSHDGYIEPYYSWVPSIGVSSLLEISSPRFELWQGDLLVYALRDQSFWRMRLRDGRAVMTEQIPFGERIREVVQGHNGELVVWSDERKIYFIAPLEAGAAASGNALYRICAGCHVAPAGSKTAIGPDLQGIVGRAVASDQNFEYSPAMRALGGAWTRERLDEFLADSRAFAPGTSMTFSGMPDAASRKALIDFLDAPGSRLDEAPPPFEW